MRVFLTGATGYVGTALLRRLAAEGHSLAALVRKTSQTDALEELGVELFEGDVTDRASMREGMSGADWVVHAAAWVDLEGPTQAMTAVNVAGSENVASLAHKLGVGRLLSVSSIASFGGSPADGSLATEEAPVQQPFPSLYSETKHQGQERIRAWQRKGLAVNTVFPSLIYGPPGKRSGTNALLRAFLRGRIPVLVGARNQTSWVHIDDVVDALTTILDRAEPGRDYLLAGEVVPTGDVVAEVCRLTGAKPPRFELSLGIARLLASASTPMMRLVGRRPLVSRAQIESTARHWAFDDTRARRELDWNPRPLAEGLPPTLEFLAGQER